MKCQKCGSELAEGTKFCQMCGNKIQEVQKEKTIKCQKCGSELVAGTKFCQMCGNDIQEVQKEKTIKCQKCGSELAVGTKFCQTCGSNMHVVSMNNTTINKNHKIRKKTKMKKISILLVVIFLIIILFISCLGDNKSQKETIQKLQQVTKLIKDEDQYVFTPLDSKDVNWEIVCTEYNSFVRFTKGEIVKYIEGQFGENTSRSEGFSYDPSENTMNIYLEAKLDDGLLSIISYNIKKDELTLMCGGEKYDATKEFEEDIRSNIIDIMKKDVNNFETQINKNNIELNDFAYITSDVIDEYIQDGLGEISVDDKVVANSTDMTSDSTDMKRFIGKSEKEIEDQGYTVESGMASWSSDQEGYVAIIFDENKVVSEVGIAEKSTQSTSLLGITVGMKQEKADEILKDKFPEVITQGKAVCRYNIETQEVVSCIITDEAIEMVTYSVNAIEMIEELEESKVQSEEIYEKEENSLIDESDILIGEYINIDNQKEKLIFDYDELLDDITLCYKENGDSFFLEFDYDIDTREIYIYLDENYTVAETFVGKVTANNSGQFVITNSYGEVCYIKDSQGEVPGGDYILPDSDTRVYSVEEFAGWDLEQLKLARNEIMARHGYIFKSESLNQYFNKQQWYLPMIEGENFDIENTLNFYEKENVELIKQIENAKM